MEECVVKIGSFSKKGHGIGQSPGGENIEVAHSALGDCLKISWKKRRYPPQKGRLLEIVTPSPDRVTPLCSHVGICGGCSWQHIRYEAQLAEKQKRLEALFGGRSVPIHPANPLFAFRNKMEFSFSDNRAGEKFLGLMIAQAEPYVFSLQQCLVGPSWFAEAVGEVRSWWKKRELSAYYPPKNRGSLRFLTLRHAFATDQRMVVLNVSGHPDFALSEEDIGTFQEKILSLFPKQEIGMFLRAHKTQKGTPTDFVETHLAGSRKIEERLSVFGKQWRFLISPSSFFQPNPKQAEVLYETALDMMGPAQRVLDLYCGTGTLTLLASHFAQEVVGVELSQEAVRDAKENQELNEVKQVEFYQGDVTSLSLRTQTWSRPFEALLLDPPRAGLTPKGVEEVLSLKVPKIVYISCNPTTQQADISELIKKGNYALQKVVGVDQFPHTPHIETVALLLKR